MLNMHNVIYHNDLVVVKQTTVFILNKIIGECSLKYLAQNRGLKYYNS